VYRQGLIVHCMMMMATADTVTDTSAYRSAERRYKSAGVVNTVGPTV